MEGTEAARLEGGSLWVDIPGYTGSLDRLVTAVQRGEVDVTGLALSELTASFRGRMAGTEAPSLDEVADFLTLAARLVALKAQALLPESGPVEEEPDEPPEDGAGRRLAEYRLFRAAVDSLLAGADEGLQSFLGLVSPDVVPVERLRVPPERLVSALRAVVERLSEQEPPGPTSVTFSVAEMADRLRRRLSEGGGLAFEEVFAGVTSRLEAVACFLALLELLSRDEATVEQEGPFAPITVRGHG